nr:hypothetical protein Iba_chr08eCG6750 [Ipomoea batatas]GME10536.1 hypothetical protein Iba_scaffold10207CG0030 [Ipomoea batatas]
MTSSHPALYDLGGTHATMVGTKGCDNPAKLQRNRLFLHENDLTNVVTLIKLAPLF